MSSAVSASTPKSSAHLTTLGRSRFRSSVSGSKLPLEPCWSASSPPPPPPAPAPVTDLDGELVRVHPRAALLLLALRHCYAQPLPRRVLEVRRGVGRLAGDVHRGHPRARAHAGPVSLCPAEPGVPVHSPGVEAVLGQVEAAVVPRPAQPGVHALLGVAGVHLWHLAEGSVVDLAEEVQVVVAEKQDLTQTGTLQARLLHLALVLTVYCSRVVFLLIITLLSLITARYVNSLIVTIHSLTAACCRLIITRMFVRWTRGSGGDATVHAARV